MVIHINFRISGDTQTVYTGDTISRYTAYFKVVINELRKVLTAIDILRALVVSLHDFNWPARLRRRSISSDAIFFSFSFSEAQNKT